MPILIQIWLIVSACGVLAFALCVVGAVFFDTRDDDFFEEWTMKITCITLAWFLFGLALIALALLVGVVDLPVLNGGAE